MPRRRDIESICLIGSGPIVIGQACEFDYAGCQALKVLRADGFRTIVVNSNPATIMTDPGFADRTYLEPLDLEGVAGVLERERPDALLPTMGGQTALNLAIALAEEGVLEDLGVELIGAPVDVIKRAEDRDLFRETVRAAGLQVPTSQIVTSLDQVPRHVSLPVILRPAFTLGGHGGGTARTPEELERLLERALAESPVGQVLVEESLLGWDEFELELMRDHADNAVVVCSIENIDPMGVHTGDSVTVAPQMTLADEAYQELRDAAIAVIRAVGVDCGGSNIQFARERETGELRVIEMNPRVSRSSALASKATGYPIAKVAAKLAVGYTLDEIPNDLTGTTPASFEPTLDYVVVKFPRFAFEKFPGADTTLGTQMKSVGEAMGIGRTFGEAFLKARRSREVDGPDAWDLPEGAHPWFRAELERLEAPAGHLDDLVADDWVRLKRLGLSDAAIAAGCGATEELARAKRRGWGVRPAYRRVDSCAAEVEARSNYFYSTWGEADEARPDGSKPRVVILGSGPNRIGQGIEFDYCCVHAAQAFRALGYEAVMVNCNPETVSTDYDTSDRLYFEPLGAEEVLEICARELPDGVVIQFGGQTPLKLAREIETEGWRILGTPFEAVDLAEDRERFAALCEELDDRRALVVDGRGRRRGGLRRGGDRVPGARPAVVRARRAEHAGLLRRRVGRGGRRDRWTRADRPLPRGRDRDRRRRALRRPRDLRRRGHGARRGGRDPFGRLVLRAAGAVARRRDARSDRGDGGEAGARSRSRRPRQRPARRPGRGRVRARGEPAGLANRAVREQGDRAESRRGRVPPRRRRAPVRSGPAPGPGPGLALRDRSQCQGRRASVRALPRRRPRARARRCARPAR